MSQGAELWGEGGHGGGQTVLHTLSSLTLEQHWHWQCTAPLRLKQANKCKRRGRNRAAQLP